MSFGKMTARRSMIPGRRAPEATVIAPAPASASSRSRSPYKAIALILGVFIVIGYGYGFYSAQGNFENPGAPDQVEGNFSCTLEVKRAIPFLKKAYGDSMHKVLHVGPDSCSIVSRLLKEDTEVFGIEPYDIEDADQKCKRMVRRGFIRVSDLKLPLPYRAKSFSLVIVSDALDYLSPKYLNRTLPELARVSSDGLIIFTGYPHNQKARRAGTDKARYGRLAKMRTMTWWVRLFIRLSLEANEVVAKKFERAAHKKSYIPNCQIFHLKSYL